MNLWLHLQANGQNSKRAIHAPCFPDNDRNHQIHAFKDIIAVVNKKATEEK